MIKRIVLFLAALFLLPASAAANEMEGAWAFKIDDAIIFIFEIDQSDDGTWRSRWTRPAEFRSNGVTFSRIGGVTQILADEAVETDGGVQFSFPDPRPEAVPNVFLFEQVSPNQLVMTYVDTPLEPFPLIRVPTGTLIGPFEEGFIYDRDNAVIEEEYVEPPVDEEPVAEELIEEEAAEEVESEVMQAARDVVEATEAAAEEMDRERGNLGNDFLDDLGEEPAAEPETVEPEVAEPENIEIVRVCSDIQGPNPPRRAELDELWGDDYEQIGTGLDIRVYTLTNGDTARVTMLGDRIYVNRCGADD